MKRGRYAEPSYAGLECHAEASAAPPKVRLGPCHCFLAKGMGTEVILTTPCPDPVGHLRVTLRISQY